MVEVYEDEAKRRKKFMGEAEARLAVLEECRRLQEEILKSRKGKPLPSLTALIHETREERPVG